MRASGCAQFNVRLRHSICPTRITSHSHSECTPYINSQWASLYAEGRRDAAYGRETIRHSVNNLGQPNSNECGRACDTRLDVRTLKHELKAFAVCGRWEGGMAELKTKWTSLSAPLVYSTATSTTSIGHKQSSHHRCRARSLSRSQHIFVCAVLIPKRTTFRSSECAQSGRLAIISRVARTRSARPLRHAANEESVFYLSTAPLNTASGGIRF